MDNNRKYILKKDFDSYKDYRREVAYYRDNGWVVRNVEGGVVCFPFIHDYEEWKRRKKEGGESPCDMDDRDFYYFYPKAP